MPCLPLFAGRFFLEMNNTIWTKITGYKLFGVIPIWTKEEASTEKDFESEEIRVVTVSDDYFNREFKKRI